MKVRSLKGQFLKAAVTATVALGYVSPALAIDFFEFDTNKLIGDPRRGTDEDYFNTAGGAAGEYTSPDNIINGTPKVAGSQPGHTESIRLGLGGSTGINVPQPHLLPASDPRSGFGTPDFAMAGIEAALGATAGSVPIWGARAAATVQWQTLADGSSIPITPLGILSGIGYNLTPGTVNTAVVAGSRPDGTPAFAAPVDDGLAPGSAVDGLTDALLWVREGDGLITGFDIELIDSEFIDLAATPGGRDGNPFTPDMMRTSAGAVLTPADIVAAKAALVARIDIKEGGGIFDQVIGTHDEDAIDHPVGGILPGFPGDALNDAIDGEVLLTGTLEDATVKNRWRAEILGVDPGPDGMLGMFPLDPRGADDIWIADPDTIRRTINFQTDVVFDGGSVFDLPRGLTSNEGALSANWINIPFVNVDGMDDYGAAPNEYDFIGDDLTIYDSSFTFQFGTGIPEPLTTSTALLAFSAMGLTLTKRRG